MSPRQLHDITGKVYGDLVVEERGPDHVQRNGARDPQWWCRCACGRRVLLQGKEIKRRNRRSCGVIDPRFPSHRGGKKPERERLWRTTFVSCKQHPERRCIRSRFVSLNERICAKCNNAKTRMQCEKRAKRYDSSFVACAQHPWKRVNRSKFVREGKRMCAMCAYRADGLTRWAKTRNRCRERYSRNPEKARKAARDYRTKNHERYLANINEQRRHPERKGLELARLVERIDRLKGARK